MGEAVLERTGFHIAEMIGDVSLAARLLALENGQTRELIVNGVRGWWRRQGGPYAENAMMGPTEKVRDALEFNRTDWRNIRVKVVEPNDAIDYEAFFTPLPAYARASQAEREEARRRLLKLADMGWRSLGAFGPRDEFYDR